jgi:hypothetical protein
MKDGNRTLPIIASFVNVTGVTGAIFPGGIAEIEQVPVGIVPRLDEISGGILSSEEGIRPLAIHAQGIAVQIRVGSKLSYRIGGAQLQLS